MNPDLVVDVGNTCIKWGRYSPQGIVAHASLPPEDPAAWQQQLDLWGLTRPVRWGISGVHPPRRDALAAWLVGCGHQVVLLESPGQLPLQVLLEHPERVGIDRLLNAVA